MLDLKFLRENPEIVKQNIRNKFQDAKLPLVDEVIALDEENRKQVVELAAHGFLLFSRPLGPGRPRDHSCPIQKSTRNISETLLNFSLLQSFT